VQYGREDQEAKKEDIRRNSRSSVQTVCNRMLYTEERSIGYRLIEFLCRTTTTSKWAIAGYNPNKLEALKAQVDVCL
jgi:hypothetical protein